MLGFHSIRPDIESGRPLRNTATAYSAPTLRARCEAPSPASCSDHSLYLFQLAGALSTGQYKWAVSKQRKRPQTANRLEGVICPRGVEVVVPVCGPDIIAKLSPQALICDPRSSSQLRVTSVSTFDQLRVTSVSTFDRARCEAPSLAPGFDHSGWLFQLAGALSTGQYKWAVSKQRKPPQTVNRLEGVICLRGVEHGVRGSSGLWTRHYRKVIAASVNLRPSQLVAAASYFGVDVRPRSVRSTFAGSRLRPQLLVVSVSGHFCHWSIQAGCVKTTKTPADCQPARGYNMPPWR